MVVNEAFECLGGGAGRGERVDVVTHVAGAVAVGGIAEYRARGRADRLGMAFGWPDDAGDAECLAAPGAVGLVAGDGEDDQWHALGECFFDAVEAAVADQQRAVGQQRGLGKRGPDPDVGRQRAQPGEVEPALTGWQWYTKNFLARPARSGHTR